MFNLLQWWRRRRKPTDEPARPGRDDTTIAAFKDWLATMPVDLQARFRQLHAVRQHVVCEVWADGRRRADAAWLSAVLEHIQGWDDEEAQRQREDPQRRIIACGPGRGSPEAEAYLTRLEEILRSSELRRLLEALDTEIHSQAQ